MTAVAGAAAALSPAAPAGAQPGDGPGASASSASKTSAGAEVDRLYAQAESATEKFNAAAERAGELREQVEYGQERAARGQAKVNRMRSALGSLAGAQYRSGGLDPAVALLLSEDPDSYLEKASTLDRIGSRQKEKLRQLRSAQRALKQQRSEAGVHLAELERKRAELKRHKSAVQKKLAAAQRLVGRLSPAERAERERPSRTDGRGGPGAGGAKASSERAAAAVAAARSAVGRPYVWGAAGPSSFDCSGLTQWAYGKAGTALPRTSQAQRSAGRQVPLSQARPGDLVLYRSDASHVGMYVGDGQVVHAPYPGAQVRYDPVDMMPVSSVTRP